MKILTAFYDLAVGPVSFDVLGFLIQARMAQHRAGAAALHVVIVPMPHGIDGRFRDKTALYDADEMHWRLWNIVIPACQLAGATVTLAENWQQARSLAGDTVWPDDWDGQRIRNAHHHAREIITAARAGAAVPRLTASRHALLVVGQWFARLGGPVVTLTLRNTYDDRRNSDTAAWSALAAHAEARGYTVVTLQDSAVALARGSGYGELNLDLRMAMYQCATLNVVANTGPCSLCWYSEAAFIHAAAACPQDEWAGHYRWLGLDIGTQLPWARPDQVLSYAPATAESLIAAFDRWPGHAGR